MKQLQYPGSFGYKCNCLLSLWHPPQHPPPPSPAHPPPPSRLLLVSFILCSGDSAPHCITNKAFHCKNSGLEATLTKQALNQSEETRSDGSAVKHSSMATLEMNCRLCVSSSTTSSTCSSTSTVVQVCPASGTDKSTSTGSSTTSTSSEACIALCGQWA